MCLCCVGWGLFLYNYWTTGTFQVCVDRAAVEKNAKLLGAQGVAATLDFFVWTSLFELQGASLVAVVMIFDVLPLVLQLCFTAYLFVRLSSSPPCRTSQPASCCESAEDARKATCCDSDPEAAVRLEKQSLMSCH